MDGAADIRYSVRPCCCKYSTPAGSALLGILERGTSSGSFKLGEIEGGEKCDVMG